MEVENQKPWVLILGGTNFMGKALLDLLDGGSYRICCINRGKTYWNDEARNQHPNIEWFCADRRDHKDYSSMISFASKHLRINSQNKWAAVVDFCAFTWRDVQSAAKAIEGITQKYIFISSDSVYNNFVRKSTDRIPQDRFDLETEFKKIKQRGQKRNDRYGYNKLKSELYLGRKNNLPYVCLRLPDVIGAYDNTNRFWTTLKWIQQSAQYPLGVSADDETLQLSLIDCDSVAKAILAIIKAQKIQSKQYNLAFEQTLTMVQLLQMMSNFSGFKANMKAVKSKSSNQMYPSVDCGPINIERALKELDWTPQPIEQAVRKAVNFFLMEGNKYEERHQVERQFRKKVIDSSD